MTRWYSRLLTVIYFESKGLITQRRLVNFMFDGRMGKNVPDNPSSGRIDTRILEVNEL